MNTTAFILIVVVLNSRNAGTLQRHAKMATFASDEWNGYSKIRT